MKRACATISSALLLSVISAAKIPALPTQTDPLPNFKSPAYWQTVFEDPSNVDYPIIFVHGIGGGFRNWETTVNSLSGGEHYNMRYNEDGILVSNYDGHKPPNRNWIWNVSYYNDKPVIEALQGDLTTYGKRLAKIIKTVRRISAEADKVVIISHSMGGLVSRAAMIEDAETWNSVHKILTVASPHEGVRSSVAVVGQLRDLRDESSFLVHLNGVWKKRIADGYRQWGVVGAVNIDSSQIPRGPKAAKMTDSGGPGFIELSSAIPFGEWRKAISDHFELAFRDTSHFGYRIAIRGEHNEILQFPAVYRAILWALEK